MKKYEVFASEGGYRFAGGVYAGGPVIESSPWFKTKAAATKAAAIAKSVAIRENVAECKRLGIELVHVADVNSIGIAAAARSAGCEYIDLIGVYDHPDHPGSNDWRIRLYAFNGIRVADTNADPVWEEEDYQVFADLLAEYGVEE